jgi:capsule polysaccharide export protein KpsE/RkpR
MSPLLAQLDASAATSWQVVLALGILLSLALSATQFVRGITGQANSRQIEPTAMAGVTLEMSKLQASLGTINRELGEASSKVGLLAKQVETLANSHRTEIDQVHARISGISREVSETSARVEAITTNSVTVCPLAATLKNKGGRV